MGLSRKVRKQKKEQQERAVQRVTRVPKAAPLSRVRQPIEEGLPYEDKDLSMLRIFKQKGEGLYVYNYPFVNPFLAWGCSLALILCMCSLVNSSGGIVEFINKESALGVFLIVLSIVIPFLLCHRSKTVVDRKAKTICLIQLYGLGKTITSYRGARGIRYNKKTNAIHSQAYRFVGETIVLLTSCGYHKPIFNKMGELDNISQLIEELKILTDTED